ncbi:MAG: hypothetical protein IPM54_19095 [Polyangiaceae bacterium]|nr:hypothetical protein [Polyangiaceae bacterium]
MAFSRPDMDGLACSEDVLRVIPDAEKIPPGYLYAYLSSKFGVPLVVGGTYGAIIQHIEPGHIADLPIPRFGKNVELRAHDLVTKAACARSEAATLFAKADDLLIELLCAVQAPERVRPQYIASASSSQFLQRGDGYYYAPLNTDARKAFDSTRDTMTVGDVADVFIPVFQRPSLRALDCPPFGIPFLSGADVFQLAPEGRDTVHAEAGVASDVGPFCARHD